VGSIGTDYNAGIYVGGGTSALFYNQATAGLIQPYSVTGGAVSDGVVQLGEATSRFKDLYLSGGVNAGDRITADGTEAAPAFRFATDTNTGMFPPSGGDAIGFSTGGTEKMRIDSSGNLLVGKTSSNTGVAGTEIYSGSSAGVLALTYAGRPLYINRLSTDGAIIDFAKDGSPVGSIGVASGDQTYFTRVTGSQGIKFKNSGTVPCNSDGSDSDNDQDLGQLTIRWDDIYATNGTIQTSDRNEKQDIAELSDAEQRVAVAAKGLLRKFRWKDAVAEKGDEARTHFGIIAQDLQAAFAAEGLDAGDYAMFISSTWTDEETGEERTRMGVRYSELLAFIIAAI
jgi:hypothetical protein